MPRVAGVGTALPTHAFPQEVAQAVLQKVYGGNPELAPLLRVFRSSGVQKRYFSFPADYYLSGKSFEERNGAYVEQALNLAEQAIRNCLDRAGAAVDQVDHLILVTTTGLATPSLDALLAPRLGLKPEVRRSPLFGLGCAGGAAALSRAAEYVRAYPKGRALAVSVEVAGQVFTPRAQEPVDLVGAALFGEGAAAALVAGDETPPGPGPRLMGWKSHLFEGTQNLMGWDFTSDGMRLILGEEVPGLITEHLPGLVEDFVSSYALRAGKISHWLLHPGGRRILEAYQEALELSDASLDWSRGSLATIGNLSSASVLFILSDVMASGKAHPGSKGIMLALGPGFSAEMLLLGW